MNKLLAGILMFSLASFGAVAQTPTKSVTEGVDYTLIEPAQPMEQDKIQVIELFWYKCPHCFQFEPHVQEWLKTKADDVEFIRLPAALNPAWALLGNAYLAAKVLGVEDKIHEPLFHAIHVERKRFPDKQSISDFFVDKAGVTAKAFSSAYDSFSVRLTMTRGADFARKWGVTGVPSIIINGKYQTTAGMTKSYDRMIETIDHLVDLERKALSTTAAAVADR